VVEHVKGNLYHLTLDGLMTLSKDDLVWSTPLQLLTYWIIEQKGDGTNQYTYVPIPHLSESGVR